MRAETLRILSSPCFHSLIYYLTNIAELTHNIKVGKTQDFQSLCFQILCPFLIIFLFFRFAMLRTVQFYNQLRLMTVKINDVISDDILSSKAVFTLAQVLIPKLRFFFCHFLAQCFGIMI